MGMISKMKLWWKTSSVTDKIGIIFRGVTATAAIGGAIGCIHEVRKGQALVKYAVKNIGDDVDVTVSESLIEDAIEKSARYQIAQAVKRASAQAENDIREQTRIQVEKTVKDCYGQITGEVGKRLATECEKLNKRDILDEIKEKAKEQLSEKFDEKLDEIADEYTKNLTNMGKVYEALAAKMNDKA